MKKLSYVLAFTLLLAACGKDNDDLIVPNKPPVQEPGQNPPPGPGNQPSQPVSIRLRAQIKVGSVLYDSLPATVAMTSWDSSGQSVLSYQTLAAGNNTISLGAGKTRFQFRISKWGITDELNLGAKDIKQDSLYMLGGSTHAKKLKYEYGYVWRENQYHPESKTDYFYHANGNLDRIVYNRKKLDGTPYISQITRFVYENDRVSRINRFDQDDQLTGFTSFVYDAGDRVTAMSDRQGLEETRATVQYNFATRQEVFIQYHYPGKTYTMSYNMQFANNNLVESAATTSHHNSELGQYQHDLAINPFFHMNWPDLYLSHSSKNNVVAQQQSFSGAYPTAVPSGYSYVYDSDGYPKELTRTYKSVITGQQLYTTKTVYVY